MRDLLLLSVVAMGLTIWIYLESASRRNFTRMSTSVTLALRQMCRHTVQVYPPEQRSNLTALQQKLAQKLAGKEVFPFVFQVGALT